MPGTRHPVLDVVELLVDSGGWPMGTNVKVVEADDDRALVEIRDDRGHGLDFICVPHDVLARPPDQPAERLAP